MNTTELITALHTAITERGEITSTELVDSVCRRLETLESETVSLNLVIADIKRQNEYYQTQFLKRHIKEILGIHAERYPFYGDNGLKNTERHQFLKSFLTEYQLKISELQELQKKD